MRILLTLIISICFSIVSNSQDKPAYQLFNKEGKKVKYDKMIKDLAEADIILFGELHNNPICHWLELEITKSIFAIKKDKTVLGAEMFESDDQLIMNEYLSGQIKKKHFISEAKVWPNNETDYQPLVDFAKDSGLHFVATNVPRRYANLVAREGELVLEKLIDEQKRYIATLPIKFDLTLSAYKMFLDMGMGHGSEMTPEKMAKSQAVKDATMAHFIMQNWKKGQAFIHYNGTYHSDNFESISWYLKQINSELKIVNISSLEQGQVDKLEDDNLDLGNYILAIPESMGKTY